MRRALGWLGRALIVTGALLVLFVVYQLWGTGLLQAADQRGLKDDFRAGLAETEAASAAPGDTSRDAEASPTPTTLPVLRPELGDAIGILSIPAIGLEQALVEGAGRDELQKGPGHYPHSPLPGHAGNVSVAGHRTTYGAPFNRLDELQPGDEIVVETVHGRFVYEITGTTIVAPDDVSVIEATGDNRITLTTCNPKYSARERLIVTGALQGDPVDLVPAPAEPPPAAIPGEAVGTAPDSDALSSQAVGDAGSGLGALRMTTALSTLVLLAAGGVWWIMFRLRPHWVTWLVGALPFLAVLFFFFGEVERLLPTNY